MKAIINMEVLKSIHSSLNGYGMIVSVNILRSESMSVHKDLIKHAENQNKSYQEFKALDQLREQYINEAVELCKQGLPFSTDKINEVTNKMNRINLRIISLRKNVTAEMVQEFVESLKK